MSAAIHMDVFDADILVAPTTQASENLCLHRIKPKEVLAVIMDAAKSVSK
jgi:hypothetical protein